MTDKDFEKLLRESIINNSDNLVFCEHVSVETVRTGRDFILFNIARTADDKIPAVQCTNCAKEVRQLETLLSQPNSSH